MKIKEFERLYCQDILERKARANELLDCGGLPYDGLAYDEEGKQYKVVYAPDEDIRLEDILSLDRENFRKEYPNPKTLAVYDRYMESIITEEGVDVLIRIRNRMREEAERISNYEEIPEGLL